VARNRIPLFIFVWVATKERTTPCAAKIMKMPVAVAELILEMPPSLLGAQVVGVKVMRNPEVDRGGA